MRKCRVVFPILLILSVCISPALEGQTNVPAGTITTDTTWNVSGSPFIVACGGVTVAPGATLTISPGVVVTFAYGGCSGSSLLGLSINGRLVANGTAAQPITFTSLTDDANSSWHGIFFNSGATGSISYANLRFGGNSFFNSGVNGMVYIASGNSLVSVTNNAISNSLTSGILVEATGTSPTVSNNTFSLLGGAGIRIINGAAPTVRANTFTGGLGTGIFATGGTAAIQNNTFTTIAGTPAISIDPAFLGTLSGNTATGPGINGVEMRTGTTIANVTWSQLTMPYVVTCAGAGGSVAVTVAPGTTLTIAPGMVVKFFFAPNCSGFSLVGLSVNGNLVANGTAAQPITFTSLTDDANSSWHGIFFNSGAGGSISYANLRFGGNPFFNTGVNGMVYIASGNSLVSVTNNAISNSLTSGILVEATGTSPTVSNNTFSLLGSAGIRINGSMASIQNNTFTTIAGNPAISIDPAFQGTLSGNTATGTGTNGVVVRPGSTISNIIWGQLSMPYVISCPFIFGNIIPVTVGAGFSLTIPPGGVVKFASNCGNGNFLSSLLVNGTLIANGTTQQNIVFTAIADDSARGDTNGDGNATTPQPGTWGSILFSADAQGSISNAIVRYGAGSFDGVPRAQIIIQTGNAAPAIRNNAVTDGSGSGIYVTSASLTTSNPISNNTFSRNSTGIQIESAGPTITGNTFDGTNNTGISVNGGTATIQNNTFTTANGSTAISIDAGFQGALSGNTATGTGTNGVVVRAGSTTGNVVWGQLSMPYVISCPFIFGSIIPVTVSAGFSLTIPPGVVVKFASNCPNGNFLSSLLVNGTLIANGTAQQTIAFTAFSDDSAGGDTNGDGNATTPQPGAWGSIVFNAGAQGSISNAIVRFGAGSSGFGPNAQIIIGTGNAGPMLTNNTITNGQISGIDLTSTGTAPTIRGNTISNNSNGVRVSGGATPHVNFNNILGNSSYGVINADCVNVPNGTACPATPDVDATNNFWGSSTGPSGAGQGTGDRVSFHVNFDPYKTRSGPDITISPTQITFAPIPVNTTSPPVTVTVTSSGTAPLLISSITTASPFAIVPPLPTNVDPGGQATFAVTFAPTAAGAFSGNVTITSNAPNSPTTVALNGSTTTPVSTGTISVSTNTAAATFTITGPATYTGSGTSFTQTNAPAGPYTITYGTVAGYITPPPESKTLVAGGSIRFDSSYSLMPPKGVHVTVGNQSVYLDWNPPLTLIDGYNLYVTRIDGSVFTPLGSVNQPGTPIPASQFTVSAFSSGDFPHNDQLYGFTLTALQSGMESANSTPVFAKPGPLLPPSPAYPILFVHGIIASAKTWDRTLSYLRNTLGWKPGGTLSIGSNGQVIASAFVPTGDYFTISFGDSLANYPDMRGILHQADELKTFIEYLSKNGVRQPMSVVAHSMGGLAARAYIENPQNNPATHVLDLVTYGTPHQGFNPTDIQRIRSRLTEQACLLCSVAAIGLTVPQVDAILASRGLVDMQAACSGPASPFLQSLNSSPLPPNIRYTSLIGHNHSFQSLGIEDFPGFCLAQPDGIVHSDGIVSVVSADLSKITSTPVKTITTDKFHFSGALLPFLVYYETGDVTNILCALGTCLQINAFSPVDLEITAPNGRRLSKQVTEIPGANYIERDEEAGHTITNVVIPYPLSGDYIIKAIGKPDSGPTDTYTLTTEYLGKITVLASNQRVQDIRSTPFATTILSPVNIDIKPGSSTNSINVASPGSIPVAMLSTRTFNAPSIVDRRSLTFGRTGMEHSLSHCDSTGEDVNADGLLDLLCHFNTNQTAFVSSDIQGILIGTTFNGVPFRGTDPVRIVQ